MIHVASLLHDDVIDSAETRRGLKSLNSFLGNKLAILAGDFLLARASVTLASLHNYQVIQLLSQVIEDLVSGEVLQVQPHLASLKHTGLRKDACGIKAGTWLASQGLDEGCHLRLQLLGQVIEDLVSGRWFRYSPPLLLHMDHNACGTTSGTWLSRSGIDRGMF